MDIFRKVENTILPTESILLIEPFKTMWSEDKSKDKSKVLKDFAFIELYCSLKKSNPFSGYEEEKRLDKVKLEVYKDINYKLSDLTLKAIEVYKEFMLNASSSYDDYLKADRLLTKIKKFLDEVDPNERDKSNKPVHKASELISAAKNLLSLSSDLSLFKEKVMSDTLHSTNKTSKQISDFER